MVPPAVMKTQMSATSPLDGASTKPSWRMSSLGEVLKSTEGDATNPTGKNNGANTMRTGLCDYI